ncbi:MAG: M6 family metalloprotease domain-containing protein [Muribaculaceae bacterium]|nr:M6 family metalloprotease domain-containing protein [Muribaculaceae bacterium]
MNKFYLRLSALLLSGISVASQCLAVPARRQPVEIRQPDGTEVTLTPVGDEKFHCFLTEDGYPADRDESGIFRLIGNDGRLTAVRVADTGVGNPECAGVKAGIIPEKAYENRRKATMSMSPFAAGPDRRQRKAAFQGVSKWDNSDGHDIRKFPSEGRQKVLVILVAFSDLDWSFSDTPHEDMESILNGPGFSGFGFSGSARDYFMESSNGLFMPEFDVYGPVTLPEKCAFYGENRGGMTTDANPARMVLDACRILDDTVDFSQYDCDGDGTIDNVYVFYAGFGENEGAESWRIWPHAWDVGYSAEDPLMVDGVLVGHYACSNELTYPGGQMAGIGTMCHEFSHVLGLPDLYATSYTGAITPGRYSLMDQGPYCNNGRTPPLYSAYERYALEWQKPVDVTAGEEVRMFPLSAHGNTYRITVDPERPWEYFLFENRQQEGFDMWLPGSGMLVWHINYDESLWRANIVNNDPMDQHVDLVEADGVGGEQTEGGDPFPGSSAVFGFTADGTPSFVDSRGRRTPLDITYVTEEADGLVVMTVADGHGEDSRLLIEPPVAAVEETGGDYFVISVPVPSTPTDSHGDECGPSRMAMSVFEGYYDEDNEMFGTVMLPGYSFTTIEPGNQVKVPGLSPASVYSVRVYNADSRNVSEPVSFAVMTSEGGVSGSVPHIRYEADNTLAWSAVENATHYLLTVAACSDAEETTTDPVTFSQRRVPAGWDYMGSMSNGAGTYGESAPSLLMSEPGDYLWTTSFDRDIRSVSFWARSVSASMARLEFYGVHPGGALYPVGAADIDSDEGGLMTFRLPGGVRQIVITATSGSGNGVYVDDVTISLPGDLADSVHPSYDGLETGSTSIELEGLEEGKEYEAWVRGCDGTVVGEQSPCVRFVAAPGASVPFVAAAGCMFVISNGVLSPSDMHAVYDVHAPDGRSLARSHSGSLELPSRGVYIVRSGTSVSRLVW